MPDVVGVRFKSCGKIYDFEINGTEARQGDLVVVESEFGLSIGNIVIERHSVENPAKELKKVLRLATEEDLLKRKDNEAFQEESRAFCLERIMARGIPMKLVCTEATLDRKRIIFYFTADGRIDFRELVKDLASKFKTRIEMRQIGVRDKAKMIGGLSLCGRELCCRRFLTTFEPISIKMAKQQELVLNTGKLSGVCGRLMCCLGYEYDDEVISDSASATDENAVPITEQDEVFEVVSEEPETTLQEPVCCKTEAPSEIQKTQAQSPNGQQPQTPSKRHKRRRRRRGRFPKKDVKSEK